MAPSAPTPEFIDITTWGAFHDSNGNSHGHELVGGRTAITTEALVAYNNLRVFLGLSAVAVDTVGEWAFAEQLTNNARPYGDDIKSVGLYYAMQGAKVGWIAQENYKPRILADIQRTARLGVQADVMAMVREFGISGYADHLEQHGSSGIFVNTLKMEPHYGGVMHGRAHGFLSVEGVAINHDVNHLTVLSWDQTQPFMNDSFDWPQWPALDVSDSGVIQYFKSMVVLGDPVGTNTLPTTPASAVPPPPVPPEAQPVLPQAPPPVQPPVSPPQAPALPPLTEPVPQPQAPDETTCSATVTPDSVWGAGFTATVSVALPSSSPGAVTWRVGMAFPGVNMVTIANLWNGVHSISAPGAYTVTGAHWNRQVPPGSTTSFGFQASGSWGEGPISLTCTVHPGSTTSRTFVQSADSNHHLKPHTTSRQRGSVNSQSKPSSPVFCPLGVVACLVVLLVFFFASALCYIFIRRKPSMQAHMLQGFQLSDCKHLDMPGAAPGLESTSSVA